jgi:hypothetical protein
MYTAETPTAEAPIIDYHIVLRLQHRLIQRTDDPISQEELCDLL